MATIKGQSSSNDINILSLKMRLMPQNFLRRSKNLPHMRNKILFQALQRISLRCYPAPMLNQIQAACLVHTNPKSNKESIQN